MCYHLQDINIDRLYDDLVESETFPQSVEVIKQLYGQSLETNSEIIRIVEKAIDKFTGIREWHKVVSLYEFCLEVFINEKKIDKEINTVFELLHSLGQFMAPENFLKVIEITKKYLLKSSLEIHHKITLLNAFIAAYLVLYGIDDEVKSYCESYRSLVFKAIEYEDYKDNKDFFRLISQGMNSLYFFDLPRKNNQLRQHAATLGFCSVNLICKDLIDKCKNNFGNRSYHIQKSTLKMDI